MKTDRVDLERGKEGESTVQLVREREANQQQRKGESELLNSQSLSGFLAHLPRCALVSARHKNGHTHTRRGSSRWTYLRATGVQSSAEGKTHAQGPFMEQTSSLNSVSHLMLLFDNALTCLCCVEPLFHPRAVCGSCCRFCVAHSG